ncbi:MAG: DUF2147 domain-containing protein [bacterium]|nr:DUF2147 domain-containing protein [bacterium]
MRNFVVLLILTGAFLLAPTVKSYSQVDKIIGKWKSIDDETKEEKSYVKIFKATNGMYYGKITKLLKDPPDSKCTECTGNKKNKPIVGMVIISKMEKDGDKLSGGKIMDPKNGKYYSCKIWLDENNKNILHVRGSVMWGAVGRTQKWIRI